MSRVCEGDSELCLKEGTSYAPRGEQVECPFFIMGKYRFSGESIQNQLSYRLSPNTRKLVVVGNRLVINACKLLKRSAQTLRRRTCIDRPRGVAQLLLQSYPFQLYCMSPDASLMDYMFVLTCTMYQTALIWLVSYMSENHPEGMTSMLKNLRVQLHEGLLSQDEVLVRNKRRGLTSVFPLAYSWNRLSPLCQA